MKKLFYHLQRMSIMTSMMATLLISLFSQVLFAVNESCDTATSSTYLSSSHLLHHDLNFVVLADTDEDDQDDDFAYDWDPSAALHTHQNTFDISLEKNTFGLVHTSVQNPSKVPLFILYHSWKSFLS